MDGFRGRINELINAILSQIYFLIRYIVQNVLNHNDKR